MAQFKTSLLVALSLLMPTVVYAGIEKIPVREVSTFISQFPTLAHEITWLAGFIEKAAKGRIGYKQPELKYATLRTLAALQKSGHLAEILKNILRAAFEAGLLPSTITKENLQAYTKMMLEAIEAETSARGLTPETKGVQYESWEELDLRLKRDLLTGLFPLQLEGHGESGFSNSRFLTLFQTETGATFKDGSQISLLIDGPASFKERERLIRNATSSIYILSWAFCNDVTGNRFAELLIQKSKAAVVTGHPIDIKIMVDGLIARDPPYGETLKVLEAAGIEVIRWRSLNPKRRYDGQHRKIMTVDGRVSIEGGMNFGDPYSHMGPVSTPKWRDTDVRVEGEGVSDAEAIFRRLWNEQLNGRKDLKGLGIKYIKPTLSTVPLERSHLRTSLIEHQPGNGEGILRANLLAIEAAMKTIDIENAYFILDPTTHDALLRAKKRGVRIRILTNSRESIDVPEIAFLILRGVNQMVADGFEVWLKNGVGQTLHSKMMTVDGLYSWVGSYNFHPRSYRYEGEVLRTVLEEPSSPIADRFSTKVQTSFEADLDAATKIISPIEIPASPVADLLQFLFYDLI